MIHNLTEKEIEILDKAAIQYIPHDRQKPKSLKHWFKWAMGKPYQSSMSLSTDIARNAYEQAEALINERRKRGIE